jgi:hypothetical protein
MPALCKHYNTPEGCKKSVEECSYKHALYCTNEICVTAKKTHTHSLEQCGQKGGGAHEAFIAEKRKVSMAEKEKKKAEKAAVAAKIEEEKIAVCEQLFPLVEKILEEGGTEGMKEFLTTPPTAGKMVGMFKEGFDLDDLIQLTNDPDRLNEAMAEAFGVLLDHQKAEEAV